MDGFHRIPRNCEERKRKGTGGDGRGREGKIISTQTIKGGTNPKMN